ncbi:MAG: MFS transporter [Chloroflexi bacterium]|nr:MFS transporter [Chloroflexota bacterium]
MRLFRQPAFLAVSLCHFSVDVLNGQMGVLLAVLSAPLGLTNAHIGLIATLYSFAGAFTQPVFGWLSDRYGGRWTTAGGVLWMALFFSLFAIAPGYWPLLFLVLGSVGSAAFHPPGAAKATQEGHTHMAGKAATAASLFFLFGQGGLSFGPALGGFIVDHLDRAGVLIVTALAAPVGLFAAWALRPLGSAGGQPARPSRVDSVTVPPQPAIALFILVLLVAGLRVWGQMAVTTFMPKFLHDQGIAPTTYGAVVALFMGGSAIGGVVGGILSDRWGRVRIIVLSFALSIIPFILLPTLSGWALYLIVALAGFFNGGPHSILVTMAQRALPGRGSLASGIALGFMFAAGATGAYLSGLAADHFGLARALQFNAVIATASTLAALLLATQKKPAPVVVSMGD